MIIDRDRPLKNLQELINLYEINDIEQAKKELPFVKSLVSVRDELEDSFYKSMTEGEAIGIEAPWGVGKTSYINILHDELKKSKGINQQDICFLYYDSLFYGNVSEAISIFISELIKKIESTYGVKLRRAAKIIAQNLTPSLEVSGVIPRLILSLNNKRSTELILSTKIKEELSNIRGKIIIAIDDIDRLTSTEALHVLRLVRVLKNIPNTYILVPLAYESLVDLLAKERIANPGGYIRKIIDRFEHLEFNLPEARNFFTRSIHTELQDETGGALEPTKPSEDLWYGYLWELTLFKFKKHEILTDTTGRRSLRMSINPLDTDEWNLADPLQRNQTNLLRELFALTRTDYSAPTNYFIRVNEPDGTASYINYKELLSTVTLSKFIEGTYEIRSSQPGFSGGQDIFTMELYAEGDVQSLGGVHDGARYTGVSAEAANGLNENKQYLWDIVRSLPNDYLPEKMHYMISARMIKRFIGELLRQEGRKKIASYITDERATAQENLYRTTKNSIRRFVESNSTVENQP